MDRVNNGIKLTFLEVPGKFPGPHDTRTGGFEGVPESVAQELVYKVEEGTPPDGSSSSILRWGSTWLVAEQDFLDLFEIQIKVSRF